MNDNFDFYKNLIQEPQFEKNNLWSLIVITAINEKQKECYEKQIETKLSKSKLPKQFEYLVTNDPVNCKIGSGGSTLNVIRQLYDLHGDGLYKMKILLVSLKKNRVIFWLFICFFYRSMLVVIVNVCLHVQSLVKYFIRLEQIMSLLTICSI